MRPGQTSIRGGVQDFLCPFTQMFIAQGAGGSYSHAGTMANDVNHYNGNAQRVPYYAPCDVKVMQVYPAYGQIMWQSVSPVRCANGYVGIVTFMTAHDESIDCGAGYVVKQGQQMGNMGMAGNATGVHCHIQISQSADTSWYRNKYGIYQFNHEADTNDCYFVDGTEILNMPDAGWRRLADVPVNNVVTDDLIRKGDYVYFSDNQYIVEDLNIPAQLVLINFGPYKGWVSCSMMADNNDQLLMPGEAIHFEHNKFLVKELDIPNQTVLLEGFDFWVDCKLVEKIK